MKNRKSNSHKKFKSDLSYGTHFEFATIPFIEEFFNKHLNKQDKSLMFLQENLSTNLTELKKWDTKYIIVDSLTRKRLEDKPLTFEIKADKYDKTGNLIFEKTCSKKPSGVFVTEAEYFVYILPRYTSQNFYIVKPEKLRDLLSTTFSSCISMGNGDGGKVTSYLVNKFTFDEEFIKIGKILDVNIEIPDKFNLTKFKEEAKTVNYYSVNTESSLNYSDSIKKYDNPLE